MANILCFGDSITFGLSDPDGGWVQRLSRALEFIYIDESSNRLHQVINLGIDADTSAGVLARFADETKPRIRDKTVIILAIGVNDAVYREDGFVEAQPEEYADNLRTIIKLAKKHTDKLIVLGLTPVIESKVQPMPWSKSGKSYSNQRINTFNKQAKAVAKAESVHFEDMFADLLKLDLEVYLHDGIHPNAVGHQYIADRIKKCVAEMANDY